MAGEKRTAKKAMAMETSSEKKAKVVAETAVPTNKEDAGEKKITATIGTEDAGEKKITAAIDTEDDGEKMTVTIDTELLKCGVCLIQLAPPLFQCTKGHITCSECCADLDYECHMCPEPETTIRCRAMERVLDGLTVPCSFRQHGCTRMVPYAERLIHEASCLHAQCYCPIAGCRTYAGLSLLKHIELEHPAIQRTRVKPACLTRLKMREGEPARVVCLGDDRAVFLVVVDRSVPSGRSLSVVRLMTEPFQEEEFKYKIEVFAKAGILSLSGEAESVGRLTSPYQASAFLFVPDAMGSPDDVPVFVELK